MNGNSTLICIKAPIKQSIYDSHFLFYDKYIGILRTYKIEQMKRDENHHRYYYHVFTKDEKEDYVGALELETIKEHFIVL